MPEGHSVHRIARQFSMNFVGSAPTITSPQGRFVRGAALLSGRTMRDARAVGKQLFLEFDGALWLRVHLGIYGAWDFSGQVNVHPSIQLPHAAAPDQPATETAPTDAPEGLNSSRYGQTGEYARPFDREAEDSVASIGAPRRTRIARLEHGQLPGAAEGFPPEPRGQVRARLLNDTVCADLRGPTVCEVLTPTEVAAVLGRLGPDPANANTPAERQRFIRRAATKKTPIALVLMDQSIIAGIGNIYRAEMLFRARLNPHTPTRTLDTRVLERLWNDWAKLLDTGIRVGQMLTIDGLEGEAYRRALSDRSNRHWVYQREGEPCRRCGTHIVREELANRKLYWCPSCQR